jgi:hypothetical protein
MRGLSIYLAILVIAAASSAAPAADTTRPSESVAWLIHFPGIDGYGHFDRRMFAGLIAGGVSAHFEVFDWTGNDPGLDALHAIARNHREATNIAGLITDQSRQFPGMPIDITAHSGGCGLAIWTLEQLPDDVKVDTVLLLAPALSPRYDLSKALRHVRGNVYVFSSVHDTMVLSAGTQIFGTIDGVYSKAAGFGGFVAPPGADAGEYRKIVPCPYQEVWKEYGDFGGHLGPLSRKFATVVLAPLLVDPPAATQPSASSAE